MSQTYRNAYFFKLFQFNVFLVIASVLTSIQGHVLEFTVEPTDTVVEAGQSAVLDCVVKASHHQQSVLIQWLDQDGSKLTFMGDLYRSQLTNGSLYINSVIEEQRLTGNYQCMATLPNFGSIVSRVAKLNIASLSGFEEEPRDLLVSVGQRGHFACRTIGAPPPKIRWLKDERPMTIDDLRMVILPSGALEIDEVALSDQGTYRCNATGLNSYKLSNKATLQVDADRERAARVSAPAFIAQPQPGTFVEGQNVSLDCAANGNPAPGITWLKDGYPIDMNDLDSRFSLVGTTSSLRITRIQEEDRGTYQCRAQNREDSLDASSLIQIQVPPKFLKKPQDKTEHATKDVELECSVYGIPEPKIQWFKNGELVKYSDYYKLVNGYNLKIMGLMLTDSGIFQCFATNEAGNIQAAASLRVQNNPDPNAEPKKPKSHPPKKVPPQQSKSLFSSLRGEYEGAGLGEAEYAHLPRADGGGAAFDPHAAFNSLKSSGGDRGDGGGEAQFAFTTRPVSAAGSEKKVAEGLPGPPRDLKAPIVKGRFVILSWRPPAENGEDIQAYAVYYKQEGSDRERYQNTSRSKLEEINVGGLTPGRTYRFRVVPFGRRGAGVSSASLTVTTQSEEHVASAPLNFDAYATSPRNVRITWRPPDTPNGQVLRYTVYYMETSVSIEHNVDTTGLSYDLNGLAPYTEYSVWVVAVTNNGAGAATEEKLVRTFGAQPSEPPINVTTEPSSTSVTVRWEPPPPDSQNGVMLGYKIKWRRAGRGGGGGGGKGSSTHTALPGERHYVIEGLEKGATYQVRLWAMNVNGTGPGSEWADVATFQDDVDESRVPEQPAYLRVRPTFDTLYVIWAPPSNQNVRVRNYILGWGKGIPDMFVHELEEKNRTYVIDRLEPNSEYVLSLRASNQMGPGPPIYTTVSTQDEPPPEPAVTLYPPMGLKAQVLSSTSVVLYWTDPSLKQSQYVNDNRYYIVQYTDDKMKKPKYLNVTDLNVMVDELKPNTLYDFSVKLVKGRKESSWSMVVQNRTWELPLALSPRDLDAHFRDEESQLVELTWQLPKAYTGRITGYVVLYTDDDSLPDPEWSVLPVKGDVHESVVYNLKPFTLYHFKVQARNTRGYGPFSDAVEFRTGQTVATQVSNVGQIVDTSGVFSSQVLLYTTISGCLLAVITIAGVVGFFCCRKRDVAMSPDRNKKGSQNIKPPDLWIHHDQMELKAMEKRHSHNDGASSSGAMTLPRSMGGNEYETHETINTNSLDKRTYVPNYVAIATPINAAALSQSSSESTPSSRQPYARTGYAMSKPHVPSEQPAAQHQAAENVYITHPVHNTAYDANVPLISGYIGQPQPVPHSLPTSSGGYAPGSTGGYAPGMAGLAEGGGKRLLAQGHPLKSFTVPAPPPISAPGTPQPKHIVTVRPNTSPFKRAQSGSPGGHLPPPSRISAAHPPPHTADEAQRLRPSSSTEELNQEMANLEGLMLTLNAITSKEFEC